MFCKNCGSEINSDQLFCPHCGTKNEQASPNQVPSQVPPNPVPSQVPPNPIPGQVPPNSIPNQVSQGQLPPYVSMNQAPPIPPVPPRNPNMGTNQVPPNMTLPPPVPPHIYEANRKKNKALVPIVIGVAVLFLIIGVVIVVGFVRYVNRVQDTATQELSEFYTDAASEDIYDDVYTEDTYEETEDTVNDGVIEDNSDSASEDIIASPDYNMTYTYTELPEVVSIDSDSRFTYYDYSYNTDVVYYTFLFTDPAAAESDFYMAVDDYCTLLADWNGFSYDEALNGGPYDVADGYMDYFLMDDIEIGINASVEDTGWYVYVNIFPLVEDTSEDSTYDYSYPNYTYYIDGRDTQYFEFGNEIQMENGVAFILNSANVYDLGDGTAEVDCNIDLAAVYEDTYLYTDSLVVVPMDSDGYILGDATLISYVTDADGNYIYEPYLLDTEYYYNYTVAFIVPEGTTSLTIYGTNVDDGYSSGPLYYFDMEVVEE